jgi:hypothetical protein
MLISKQNKTNLNDLREKNKDKNKNKDKMILIFINK